MTGTMTWVTFEMRWTPPKMTRPVAAASTRPMIVFMLGESLPVDSATAAVMEFDCTALNTKP